MKKNQKKIVKIFVSLIALGMLASFTSCSTYEIKPELVGVWYQEDHYALVNFKEDGTFNFRTGLLWGADDITANWTAAGNMLKLTYTDSNGIKHTATHSYSISGNKFTLNSSDSSSELMQKIGRFSPYYKE